MFICVFVCFRGDLGDTELAVQLQETVCVGRVYLGIRLS